MKWVNFNIQLPPKSDYYYVSWHLKKPRIRKYVCEIMDNGGWISIEAPKHTELEDELLRWPTHWAEIK